ncbi:hypothetical protein F511_13233 [Dorcoceras hygrometricum]|uniref:Uncharacterized protein n=1 Tax=Dorcoceras hygrometricum TaxID=472368 RepID=A0A2Z7D8Q5_9LAMI|nr:hypothetical protein F511_13233 [Dorcoceras hygrometricum]
MCRHLRDRTCFDHHDEEFPSVLNSSVLLVQADEDQVCSEHHRAFSSAYGLHNSTSYDCSTYTAQLNTRRLAQVAHLHNGVVFKLRTSTSSDRVPSSQIALTMHQPVHDTSRSARAPRSQGYHGYSAGRGVDPAGGAQEVQRLGEPQFRPFQHPGPSRFGQYSHPQFSGPQFAQVNDMTREQAEGTPGGGVIADVVFVIAERTRSAVVMGSVVVEQYGLLFTEPYLLRLSAVEESDWSKSGSAGLLLQRRFFLYHFRRLGLSWKKIAKGATLCSLLAFRPSGYSVQVTLWVSVIFYLKLRAIYCARRVSDLSARDLDCGNCSSEVKLIRRDKMRVIELLGNSQFSHMRYGLSVPAGADMSCD